ncbi:MAG: SEL1-like repeat protein [Alphaproteobacteria bacterium]|nr:SEL1-like repeat protein [Alphaproteobacteria bacterium]
MLKKLFVLVCLFYGGVAYAKCPLAEAYLKNGKKDYAFESYQSCALDLNDAESQMYVGSAYLNGTNFVEQDLDAAFYYFRMGAENGYAPAQRELAKLIDALEEMGDQGKQALTDFESQWSDTNDREPLSALAWMILAAEKAENKWFYNAPAIADEEAIKILPAFRSRKDVSQAEKQAIAFKQEKLMEQAKKLLTASAYRDFESIIYPEKQMGKTKGRMTKADAIENLKKYKMSIQK